jgi:RNA polymerase sigma factor (sigma-70 family)
MRMLEAARTGDEQALSDLFERFYPRVQGLVHRSLASDLRLNRPWLNSLFSTGDVVQDVFQSVLRDLDGFRGQDEDAFAGYLAIIVRNRLLDSIRFHQAARRDRRRVGSAVEDVDPASSAVGPSTQVTSAEDMARFSEALTTFPERERLLLRERLERNEQFQTLANRLGYPSADAARKAFYSAQARLLVRLQHPQSREPE